MEMHFSGRRPNIEGQGRSNSKDHFVIESVSQHYVAEVTIENSTPKPNQQSADVGLHDNDEIIQCRFNKSKFSFQNH